jgi:hypothetical protein
MSIAPGETIPIKLPNGAMLYIETPVLEGKEKVAISLHNFDEVTHVLEGIAQSIATTMKKVKPRKATVEFGLEIALKSGKLATLLVEGSGTSNLKVTLEWGETEGTVEAEK